MTTRTAPLRALFRHLAAVGVVFLAIGEIWFRLPWTTRILLYEFDEERIYRIAPGQARGLGLGSYSVVSPRMGINSHGFRNDEIDWSTPIVVAVGSSEVLGPGMEDDEVWTAILADRVSSAARRKVTIVNAGVPGYGPYHQAVTVREYLERYPAPSLLVVRVAVADRAFARPAPETRDHMRRHFAISRIVRRHSEFLPYLVNRIEAQVFAIRRTFTHGRGASPLPADEAPVLADEMWSAQGKFWKEMADLATARGTPVLFFVDGADGAPSGERLRDILAREFRRRSGVRVALFGGRQTGLDIADDELRRRRYREELVLGYDAHANAKQHRLIAEFLTPLLSPLVSRPGDGGHASRAATYRPPPGEEQRTRSPSRRAD